VSDAQVHPTALVHPGARLGAQVSVGAYSIVGEHVEIGEGTSIGPHVVLEGRTRLGRRNRIHPFCAIGGAPQDKKYAGEETSVEVGDGNTIREYVSINRGTTHDAGVTRIGDDNWIMAYVHVAHDCRIGSHTIFANACQLAGHVEVDDWAIVGGVALLHQFVRVGAHSFTGMGAGLSQDVPPFVKAAGNLARPYGINSEGLRRRGFSADAIARIKRAYRTLYRDGLSLEEARERLAAQAQDCAEVGMLLQFIARSKRGIIR
jgi:UDP-N-acetylglucosamine acyltransferase